MDINDVIIIKFVIMYYCLQVPQYSYCEPVAHVQTVRSTLKPRLLLSNGCHVEYFDLTLALYVSLNSPVLANQAASVVHRP